MTDHIQNVTVQNPSQIIKVAVADLLPHYLEAGKSGSVPSRATRALADKMTVEGQQAPIEILPDLTVVSDHEPVRAARLRQWNEMDAIVRGDLADQGEVAIEEHVLLSRLDRQGRDPLEVARDLKHLHEIGQAKVRQGWLHGDLLACQRTDLRSQVAEVLQQTGRSLNRWMRVLDAPVAVQDAYIRKEIKLVDAEAVGRLRANVKDEIVKAIEAGNSVKQAIAPYLKKDGKPKDAWRAFRALLPHLKKSVMVLKGREGVVDRLPQEDIEALDEFGAVLQRIRQQVQVQ